MKLTQEVLLEGVKRADIQELKDAGYVNDCLDLTDMGEKVLVRSFVLSQFIDALIKRAKEKNAKNRLTKTQ